MSALGICHTDHSTQELVAKTDQALQVLFRNASCMGVFTSPQKKSRREIRSSKSAAWRRPRMQNGMSLAVDTEFSSRMIFATEVVAHPALHAQNP
jgi:hypothetical protein